METKEKSLIKKLFDGGLEPGERAALNGCGHIHDILRKQWDSMSEEVADRVREERIWNGIMGKVRKQSTPDGRRITFYRYGMVAMLAVCMLLSALLLTGKGGEEVVYVVRTGYRSMDSVRLSDGTKVMLGAGSRLSYPRTFSGKRREVLLSGQAFFDVMPDKSHPFVVKTPQMDVTALGTSFEVFGYDGDDEAETVLLSGKVKVEMPGDDSQRGRSYMLAPNEKLTYSHAGGVSLATIDADAYSSWRQGGRMSFRNETLEMILGRLEKWYGQKIACDARIAAHYRFTFTMRNESLEMILNYISHSAPLDYRLVSNDCYVIEERDEPHEGR